LTSYSISCIRERRGIAKLYNEKARLDDVLTRFKSNNEEYLDKIKQAAEEKIKEVLTNGKYLLQFAVASVIKSLRSNSEIYNFISYSTSVETTSTTYGSNYRSLISEQQMHQQQSFNDVCTALILEEAEKLNNILRTKLISRVITANAAISESSLSLPSYNNNRN